MKKNKLLKSVKLLFILCWLGYFANCISRYHMSACMPQMLFENAFSVNELAMITAGFFLCYAFGQVINGIIGDKLNPYWMIATGMLGSAMCNLMIFLFPFYIPTRIFWTINGVFQSLVWPPMVRIVAELCNEEERMTFCTALATTVPCGTVFAYGISILMIKFVSWQSVFLISGLCVVGIALLWIFKVFSTAKHIIKDKARIAEALLENKTEAPLAKDTKPAPIKSILRAFCISGAIIGFLPVLFHGAIMEGLATWLPTFVNNTGLLPMEYSLVVTMVITLVNVFGAFIATAINRKVKNEFLTTGIVFAFTFICLTAASLFVKNSYVVIAGMMFSSLSMSAVNTMLASLFPMKFVKLNRTSMIAGITNGIIYGGGSLFGFFVGNVIEKFSYSGVLVMWAGVALAALVISLLIVPRWKKYTYDPKNNDTAQKEAKTSEESKPVL